MYKVVISIFIICVVVSVSFAFAAERVKDVNRAVMNFEAANKFKTNDCPDFTGIGTISTGISVEESAKYYE